MSYNPNIPNLTDFRSLSQKQMLANFQAINNSFLANHIGLTDKDDPGLHNVLLLRPQTTDPVTAADNCAIYNKLVSGSPQLFFLASNNPLPIQLTNSKLNTKQTGAPLGAQSSFIAGPFTVFMGYVIDCPTGQVVNLNSSSLIYVGLSTTWRGFPTQINVAVPTNITGGQFTIEYKFFTTPEFLPIIYYMAIGL